ncbi:hypothetical protein IQ07DRAFT_516181 [Pyrenochaeta sp. DS3sAY3a]|nr:hypothetical protein IQ07DRAFT_516181 [Pyrenochaeta sp. DS3sAY3a]
MTAAAVEYPQTTTTSTITEQIDKSSPSSPPQKTVFDIDEFVALHQPAHDALVQARAAAKLPQPKKQKINPQNAVPLTPVAIGARSSKFTILFHEKYQGLGLANPEFTWSGDSDRGWSVAVSFAELGDVPEVQGLSEEGRYPNKQAAKEALCRKALGVLEELEREGRVGKRVKGVGVGGAGGGGEQMGKQVGENYIGQLLEFQRSLSANQPTYNDYSVGPRFTCQVTIDGVPTPFGSLTTLSSSKKEARQQAAGVAVAYFKAQGVWPEKTGTGGIKKKKAPVLEDGDEELVPLTTTSPSTQAAQTQAARPTACSPSPPRSPSPPLFAHVNRLAALLSLPPPEYRITPPSSPDGCIRVAAYFRNGGAHAGPIGEVSDVWGKRKAREECARLVAGYLEGVKKKVEMEIQREIEEGEEVEEGEGEGVWEDAVEKLGG